MSTAAWTLNVPVSVTTGGRSFRSIAIPLSGATQLLVLATSLPSDANVTGTPGATIFPFTFTVNLHTAYSIAGASPAVTFGLGYDAVASAAVRLPLAPSTRLVQCDIVTVDVNIGDTSWFGTHSEVVTVDVFTGAGVEALPPALPAVALPLAGGVVPAAPATGTRAEPAVDVTSGGSQLVTAGPGTALDIVLRSLAVSLGGGATQSPLPAPATTSELFTLAGGMPDEDWRSLNATAVLTQTSDGGLRLSTPATGTAQLELRSPCGGNVNCSVSFMIATGAAQPVTISLGQRINAPVVTDSYVVGMTFTPTTSTITRTGGTPIDVSALVQPSSRLTTITFNVSDAFVSVYLSDTVTTTSTLLTTIVRTVRCPALWLSLAVPAAALSSSITLYSAAIVRTVPTNFHPYSFIGSYIVLPDIVTFNGGIASVSACNSRSLRLVGINIDPDTVSMWIFINTNKRYTIATAPVAVDPNTTSYSVTGGPPAYDTLARTDSSIQSMAAVSTWYPPGTPTTIAATGVTGTLVYTYSAKQNTAGLLSSSIEAANIHISPGDDLLVLCTDTSHKWAIGASTSLQWVEH